MIKVFDSIDAFDPMGTPTAVALGFFDGVHMGHRAVILRAVDAACRSVVLTFRESPAAVMNRSAGGLLLTNEEKTRRLDQLGVDAVVYADFLSIKELSAEEFVRDVLCEKFRAASVFCGFNYHFGHGGSATGDDLIRLCEMYGIRAVCCDAVTCGGETVSSTRIRSLLERGDIEGANRLLCEPYTLSGRVEPGNHIGTKLGFPTVNLPIDPILTVPRYGVYAARVDVGGVSCLGATNIGVHPTAGAEPRPLCETFILGFDDDLYGRDIRVSLLLFLREERRFDSLDILREQVARDCAAVESLRPTLI